MFYFLYELYGKESIFFNVFRYVTFRSAMAFVTAFLFSFIVGPWAIRFFKKIKVVESISCHIPQHSAKKGTPSMGGVIIIAGLLLSSLLWNKFTEVYILILYFVTIWLGILGFLDDYLKNIKGYGEGLVAKHKLLGQVSLALLVFCFLYILQPDLQLMSRISVPFFKNSYWTVGYLFIPFVMFLIVGSSNAVNISDGLDGLASGLVCICLVPLGILAYMKGNIFLCNHFHLEFIKESSEICIFIFAMIGTTLGFLWYNIKPAQIFMGDTGSLCLGGLIAVTSIIIREELFLGLVSFVFITETLSSFFQTSYFKYTKKKFGKGKRLFLCAPLHHHFEKKGLSEEKIVVRFWIIASISAALALITIKLR